MIMNLIASSYPALNTAREVVAEGISLCSVGSNLSKVQFSGKLFYSIIPFPNI